MAAVETSHEPVVVTTGGAVRGREKRGVLLFAGIPYAAPPVGDRRFGPPEAHEGWSGTRDATRFGPPAPQAGGVLGGMFSMGGVEPSEDCLTLNVQTPAIDDAGRPVMVWIHGGGFTSGTGATPWYDGTALCTRGDVVVVTLNYRLGALGFLHTAGLGGHASSGLAGILDQVAALEWVRDNVAAFGGDPDQVTIFGESAGGMSVGVLLGLPAARGLFRRAIAQSGAASNVLDTEAAAHIAAAFCDLAGTADLDALRAAPVATLLEAQAALPAALRSEGLEGAVARHGTLALALPLQPVVDGHALPRPPLDAVADGAAAGVDLMAGTTRDEWNLFHLLQGGPSLDAEVLRRRLASVVGDEAGDMLAFADRVRPNGSPDDHWCAALTEIVFTRPCRELLAAQAPHARTWQYEFTWPTPAFGGALGSCHALEIPFVFHSLDRAGVSVFLGEDPPVELADRMCEAWWRFARTGDPRHDGVVGWEPFSADVPSAYELGTS